MSARKFTVLATIVVLTPGFGASAAAATLNVPSPTYPTIQDAINAATDGDEVVVAPGTYNEKINLLGKAIRVRSSDGPDVTIIDGTGLNDSVVKCVSGEGPDTVLDGFTITDGTGVPNPFGDFVGGGMYNFNNSSPTVTNCTFSDNTADLGGGMYNTHGSSPTLTNCTFSGNTAYGSGGGLFNSGGSLTVTDCTFSGNSATSAGGGMLNNNSSPTVTNCTFSRNTATGLFGGGGMFNTHGSSPTVTNCTFSGNTVNSRGGGMFNTNASSPTVTNCTFSGNTANASNARGGGMYNFNNSSPTVTNCTFSGNTVNSRGGGMFNNNSSPTVTNCTFIGNTANAQGGGLFNSGGSPTVTNCTFSGNTAPFGGGMYSSNEFGGQSNPTVLNCILWDNGPNQIADVLGAVTTVSYSDVQGGFPGTGNINADPLFVDADGLDETLGTADDNLRLLAGSPAIDAGDNTAVPIGVTTDLDGKPRFADDPNTADSGNGTPPIVDMGAYEVQPVPCETHGDCDDADVCTDDSCGPAGRCLNTPNTERCNDGNMCTHDSCDPATGCVNTPNTEPCNDGDPCTTADTCSGGICLGGPSLNCDDGNVCTDDSCDPATGCVNTPNAEPCDDGDPCTTADTCSGGICLGGPPPDCDEGEVCVNGICRSPDPITWHVDDDNCPGPGRGTVADPFCMIQDGIDVAVNGDEIVVAPGTYNEKINFLGKAITVLSSAGPGVTTIDATGLNDSVVRCINREGPDTVLEGFTITAGSASCGGGMYNLSSSPTVTNCIFSGNTAHEGGGMCNLWGGPTATNCTFTGNTAGEGGGMSNIQSDGVTVNNCTFIGNNAVGRDGGGMFNWQTTGVRVTNCTFSGNTADRGDGGGMFDGQTTESTVTDCAFTQNTAYEGGGVSIWQSRRATLTNCTFTANTAVYDGGGMFEGQSEASTLTNCAFTQNTAGEGGGVSIWQSYRATLTDCTFTANTAVYDGGGMFDGQTTESTVTNCAFTKNTAYEGGGVSIWSDRATITNCTFTANTAVYDGGGMFDDSRNMTVTNCILWGDSPDEIVLSGSAPTIRYSDVQGGLPTGATDGGGNISVNPMFVDAPNGDLRLSPGSPCIDAGDNEAVADDVTTDIEGNPRFVDDPATLDTGRGTPPIVDMGAFEFQGVLEAILDIKPGSCPNPANVRSRGAVPMAIVGSESFDVTEIVIDSLALTRADGVGEVVTPISRRSGRTGSIEDVATPFNGQVCECHDLAGDGIDDLVLKFSTQDLANLLELNSERRRASVTLTLSGSLVDGTEFEASDCVVVTGRGLTASQRAIQERGKR
jgi:parallel beta-helix repeat protein